MLGTSEKPSQSEESNLDKRHWESTINVEIRRMSGFSKINRVYNW